MDFGKKQNHSVVAVVERVKNHYYLRHCHQFNLDTPYGVVIVYVKRLQDNWNRLVSVSCDQTGVGEYIVEDMRRAGVRNVSGVVFTEQNKEAMATALKEIMRSIECPVCGWSGYIESLGGEWRTTCPNGCRSELGNLQKTVSRLHIPYDLELFIELNSPTYQLIKVGRIKYSHPLGTHDDSHWSICLSIKDIFDRKRMPIATI